MPRKCKMALDGLADEWEQSAVLRARLREEQRVLSVDGPTLKCTVGNVSAHMEVVEPVLKMTKGKLNLQEAPVFGLSLCVDVS